MIRIYSKKLVLKQVFLFIRWEHNSDQVTSFTGKFFAHGVSLGTESPDSKEQPSYFSVLPGTLGRQKALIISPCCTCLTITLSDLISEQPTNMSWFLVTLVKWFNRTIMSQNWQLVGCLAKTGQYRHLKLSPESRIFFLKVFFWQVA